MTEITRIRELVKNWLIIRGWWPCCWRWFYNRYHGEKLGPRAAAAPAVGSSPDNQEGEHGGQGQVTITVKSVKETE